MTREELLIKAMAIAKRNGFDLSDDFFTETPAQSWIQAGQDLYYSLIFDHTFAKAFWGENLFIEFFDKGKEEELNLLEFSDPIAMLILRKKIKKIQVPAWQFHLSQMVLCPDPLEYLRKFIDNDNQIEYEN
jgi:hypothetical protein